MNDYIQWICKSFAPTHFLERLSHPTVGIYYWLKYHINYISLPQTESRNKMSHTWFGDSGEHAMGFSWSQVHDFCLIRTTCWQLPLPHSLPHLTASLLCLFSSVAPPLSLWLLPLPRKHASFSWRTSDWLTMKLPTRRMSTTQLCPEFMCGMERRIISMTKGLALDNHANLTCMTHKLHFKCSRTALLKMWQTSNANNFQCFPLTLSASNWNGLAWMAVYDARSHSYDKFTKSSIADGLESF